MRSKHGTFLLVIAALVAISTALAHVSCIYFGPQCYSVQMAPQFLVDSAQAGTLLAPLSAIAAFAIFILCGSYALSGAGLIRKLPFLDLGIYVIAVVCILRGLLPLQLWIRHPDKVDGTVLIVGVVWLAVGLCYFFGYRVTKRNGSLASKP